VLIPPIGAIFQIVKDNEVFSSLAEVLALADLDETLSGDGTFTLFAPNDAAFGELPKNLLTKLVDPMWKPQLADLLLYHVLGEVVSSGDLNEGMTATLNGEDISIKLDPPRINGESKILTETFIDVEADNGIIHGIDAVLAPPSLSSSIVDIAVEDGRFSTLVEAITAAGLEDTLSDKGPFTVFAPTDEAFEKLSERTLESLLKPKNKDALINILKYHVVAANTPSSSLSSGKEVTLNGDSVKVTVSNAGIMVDDANVVVKDIITSNGIIHAIDSVLMPPSKKTSSESSKSSKSSKSTTSSESTKSTTSSESSSSSKSSKSSSKSKSSKSSSKSKSSKSSSKSKSSKSSSKSKRKHNKKKRHARNRRSPNRRNGGPFS